MTFTFPLPPDSMRVNRRQGHHWGGDNREKVAYMSECKAAVREQAPVQGQTLKRCHMTLTVHLGKGQRCDPPDAGSWAKGAIDVLVKEGILADDNSRCIKSFTVLVDRDWVRPRLEIMLEGVG